ncbi:MAG: hypothetical protein PHE89_06350 [Alphaproteobacteria bacterium]|nr:hypothetical protein [Alphaproteobacteria bacterium]
MKKTIDDNSAIRTLANQTLEELTIHGQRQKAVSFSNLTVQKIDCSTKDLEAKISQCKIENFNIEETKFYNSLLVESIIKELSIKTSHNQLALNVKDCKIDSFSVLGGNHLPLGGINFYDSKIGHLLLENVWTSLWIFGNTEIETFEIKGNVTPSSFWFVNSPIKRVIIDGKVYDTFPEKQLETAF